MNKVFKTYLSEWMRVKSTSLIYLTIGIPLLLALTLLFAIKNITFELDGIITIWGYMILPLGSIVLCVISTCQFQNNNLWKTLIAQPVSRFQVMVSHILFNISIVLLGTLVLYSVLFLEIYFSPVQNELQSQYLFSQLYGLFFQFSLTIPIIIAQTIVILISSSLAFSLTFGIGGFLIGAIVPKKFEMFQYFFVFDYINFLGPGSGSKLSMYQACGVSAAASIVLFTVGYMLFKKKEF